LKWRVKVKRASFVFFQKNLHLNPEAIIRFYQIAEQKLPAMHKIFFPFYRNPFCSSPRPVFI
jgi:hypothetical protein